MQDLADSLEPLQRWLRNQFPQSQLLLVGGSVRDFVRGQASKDLDIEVLGVDSSRLQEGFPWPHKQVGRSFAHWLVQLEGLGWVELSLEPEPVAGSLDEHWKRLCLRRDFTCNAMAWDLDRGILVDPMEGARDIAAGVLRQTGPQSLPSDPLRLYRAAQFCARFDWRPEPETLASLKLVVDRLASLPRERVTREWEKLLCLADSPDAGLACLREWGVIAALHPELEALAQCPQDPIHHPEGNVWIHTLLVVEQAAGLARQHGVVAEERLILLLAALLHDIGKPATTRRDGQRVTAHGHERAGVEPAAQWLAQFCFGENIDLAVLDCVAHHMRPAALTRQIEAGELSPSQQVNALRRLLRDLQKVNWPTFLLLCEADRRGRGVVVEEFAPARVLGELLERQPVLELSQQPLLRGRDLLPLGILPGKEMGMWIQRVEEARDQGLIETFEQAVDWVRTQLL